jgi:hypothetical protein
MIDPIELGSDFFERLTEIDKAIVERAAEEPCGDCGGPLYRSDYARKPRGGLLKRWPVERDDRVNSIRDDAAASGSPHPFRARR